MREHTMTDTLDISDNWRITREQIGAHNDRQLAKIKHNNTGVSVVAKEQPNGAEVQLRVTADLPGGFDTVHQQTHDTIETAFSELERYAAMYDANNEWPAGTTITA